MKVASPGLHRPRRSIASAFQAYPAPIRKKLFALRALILDTARSTDGVGELEETLKWGEPAYATTQSKSGSTVRIGWKKATPSEYALYFNCRTSLVATFREIFREDLRFEGNRAIVFAEGDPLPTEALSFCIAAALTYHRKASSPAPKPRRPAVLLAGGNPQIAKGIGEAPVQAYLAALPGWKREAGRLLDRLVVEAFPGVCKAVKWNSPFYGSPEHGWFLSFHGYAKYIKVAFFNGTLLRPLPPGASKQPQVRYLDFREGAVIDREQFRTWVAQGSKLPGWKMAS